MFERMRDTAVALDETICRVADRLIDKYKLEAPKIKALFDDKLPKLCGTYTFMRQPVANSKIHVMRTLFNFLFNDGPRAFGNSDKKCETSADTEQSLIDLLESTEIHLRFVGEDYTERDFTGKGLHEIYYTNRQHSFSSSGLRQRVTQS